MITEQSPRVFLSYSYADKIYAGKIKDRLVKAGIVVKDDVRAGDDFSAAARSHLAASDYVVLVLSPDAVNSEWFFDDLDYAVQTDWRQRGITALPIMIRQCAMPEVLRTTAYVDGTSDLDRAIDLLIERLQIFPSIILEDISPLKFEQLIFALLGAYQFQDVEYVGGKGDLGIDLTARYEYTDPFGRPLREQWLVQIKATVHTDLATLRSFLGLISLRKGFFKPLFVTKGQLTSAARALLEEVEKTGGPRISVLEGDEVRRLIVAKQDIMGDAIRSIREKTDV